VLEIAIPHGATPAQIEQINRAIAKAAKIGVDVVPIVIK